MQIAGPAHGRGHVCVRAVCLCNVPGKKHEGALIMDVALLLFEAQCPLPACLVLKPSAL